MVVGVLDELKPSDRGAASRSGSPMTSRERASTTTQRSISSRPTRHARSSSAWARTGPSVRTRTRSRSSAPKRDCTRRAISSTTRRSRARRRCRICASVLVRSGLPTSSSRRASSAATSSAFSTVSTCSAGGARRNVTAQLRTSARGGLGCAFPAGSGADPRPSTSISMSSMQAESRARRASPGASTSSSRPASSRSPAWCRASRRSNGSRRRSRRPTAGAAPRSSNVTRRPSTTRSLDCIASKCPAGHRRPRAAARGPRPRARVRPHRHRGDAGRAGRRPAGQRAARRRDLSERYGGVREAQHLRSRRGVGRRPVHPVRQLQLRLPAQRDPLEVLRPVPARRRRRTASSRRRSRRRVAGRALHAAGLPRGLHRLRALRRGLPGVVSG